MNWLRLSADVMFVYNVYLEQLFVIVSRGRLCHEIWQRVGRNIVLSNVRGVYDQITQLVDSKGDLKSQAFQVAGGLGKLQASSCSDASALPFQGFVFVDLKISAISKLLLIFDTMQNASPAQAPSDSFEVVPAEGVGLRICRLIEAGFSFHFFTIFSVKNNLLKSKSAKTTC